MKVLCIKVNKNGKYVTATHSLEKGKEYNLQSPEAARLVALGICEYTKEAKDIMKKSEEILANRKKAKEDEEAAAE